MCNIAHVKQTFFLFIDDDYYLGIVIRDVFITLKLLKFLEKYIKFIKFQTHTYIHTHI